MSATTAWVSGYTATDGVVMRTTDRGATWQDVSPSGAAGLQFRDIEAFDANRAVAMSIGNNPSDFRIYATANGGQTWNVTLQNTNPGAFYDCMTFFDNRRGLLLSDPPDGQHFLVLATDDGGLHWRVTGLQMPAALPGEAGFAASGECITSHGGRAWFGTTAGRVFRSDDRGTSWTVAQTPVASGSGSTASSPWRSATSSTGSRSAATSLRRRPRPITSRARATAASRGRCSWVARRSTARA